MNTKHAVATLLLMSAAFSVSAQEPDATTLPGVKAQPIQHVFDCGQRTLPTQRQVGEWTGQHNFSQVYATRARLMGDVARYCNRAGVEQVNLVFDRQPAHSKGPRARWVAEVGTAPGAR